MIVLLFRLRLNDHTVLETIEFIFQYSILVLSFHLLALNFYKAREFTLIRLQINACEYIPIVSFQLRIYLFNARFLIN